MPVSFFGGRRCGSCLSWLGWHGYLSGHPIRSSRSWEPFRRTKALNLRILLRYVRHISFHGVSIDCHFFFQSPKNPRPHHVPESLTFVGIPLLHCWSWPQVDQIIFPLRFGPGFFRVNQPDMENGWVGPYNPGPMCKMLPYWTEQRLYVAMYRMVSLLYARKVWKLKKWLHAGWPGDCKTIRAPL